MRKHLSNTVHDWDKMLKRVYETQGPTGFAKYQYSISSILQLLKSSSSLEKLLEYCKDIPDPKDVLINAISEIMLDHTVNTNTRISATATLYALIPRMKGYPGLKGAAILETMKKVLARTGEESLQDALTETINAANRRLQKYPRAYAIKL